MADPNALRAAAAKLGARLAQDDAQRKHSAAQTRDAESTAIRDKYRRIAEHRRYPKKEKYSWEDLVIGSMAMDAGINRYYAMKAGPQAKKALDYLSQAAQAAKPETKIKALRLARRHLADVSRDHHPELVEQLEGRILWEEGWRPETWDAERNTPRERGPSINPQTGQQEFFSLGGLWDNTLGKLFDKDDPASKVNPPQLSSSANAANAAQIAIEEIPIQGRPTPDPLTLTKELDRRRSIVARTPARFNIEDNPDADPSAWWANHNFGKGSIERYEEIIQQKAKEVGVDPRLLKTVLYTEAARGHKFGGNDLGDITRTSSSVMPGNVQYETWKDLGIDKKSAYDPEVNIGVTAEITKGIYDRLENPSAAKVVTLYRGLGLDKVDGYGAYGQKIYDSEPWLKPYLPTNPPD